MVVRKDGKTFGVKYNSVFNYMLFEKDAQHFCLIRKTGVLKSYDGESHPTCLLRKTSIPLEISYQHIEN